MCVRNNSNLHRSGIELLFNDYNGIIPIDFVLCQYKNMIAQQISSNFIGTHAVMYYCYFMADELRFKDILLKKLVGIINCQNKSTVLKLLLVWGLTIFKAR